MKKKIILTGGGTGGSVTPLLALVPDFQAEGWEVEWIGTHTGIEKNIVSQAQLPYYSISSGKLRRYFSWQNLVDIFHIKIGFFQSLKLLLTLKPDAVMSAGGYVSVPVVWAAWCLRIPVAIHQQDIRPGLANKLMSPCASLITVTFEKSLQDYSSKAIWTGNPIRSEFFKATHELNSTDDHRPKILFLGGGTGAQAINELVQTSLFTLTEHYTIIHLTGEQAVLMDKNVPHYHVYSFLNAQEMAKIISEADVVVTRAGLGTLTELSYLAKAIIIIPMPDSHQEDNAYYFSQKGAAIILAQADASPKTLLDRISELLNDSEKLKIQQRAIKRIMKPQANATITNLIKVLMSK